MFTSCNYYCVFIFNLKEKNIFYLKNNKDSFWCVNIKYLPSQPRCLNHFTNTILIKTTLR